MKYSFAIRKHLALTSLKDKKSLRKNREDEKCKRYVQIFPKLHCENLFSDSDEVGLMMKAELASQVLEVKGQQTPERLQPAVHFTGELGCVSKG
jgi:hypothetical protein